MVPPPPLSYAALDVRYLPRIYSCLLSELAAADKANGKAPGASLDEVIVAGAKLTRRRFRVRQLNDHNAHRVFSRCCRHLAVAPALVAALQRGVPSQSRGAKAKPNAAVDTSLSRTTFVPLPTHLWNRAKVAFTAAFQWRDSVAMARDDGAEATCPAAVLFALACSAAAGQLADCAEPEAAVRLVSAAVRSIVDGDALKRGGAGSTPEEPPPVVSSVPTAVAEHAVELCAKLAAASRSAAVEVNDGVDRSAAEEAKRKKAEAQAKKRASKFARKKPVYAPCSLEDPQGVRLCFCNLRKLQWCVA